MVQRSNRASWKVFFRNKTPTNITKDNNVPIVVAVNEMILKMTWTVGVDEIFDKEENELLAMTRIK